MAQVVAFQAALARIGFGQQAIASLDANGLTSVRDLIHLSEKDVEQLLKIVRAGPPAVTVPFLAQKRLNIFCYWAKKRNRMDEPIEPVLFNQAAIESYGSMMVLEDKDEEIVVKAPGEYKRDTKWKAFKEGAIAYFNGIKGNHNIPLAYVIREDENPQVNMVFQSEHHRMIAITPLVGAAFEDDNGKVFDLLKSWTINGPAWTWMRAYNATRNGRQAWLALLNHFEGDAQRDRVKDAAYASIAAARYYGEKKKFTFETYVTIHQDAYADLEQYGEIISEEKRVRDLLANIKDNSPAANAAKGTVLATPNLRTNFSNAVAHLATTLQLGQSQDTRNISSTNTNKGGARGGRGGRGRGGRSQGRGRGRNIYLGSYAPDAWYKLSSEDKKRVIEGRAKSAEQQSQNHQGRGRGASRQVAAVSAEDGQDTTTLSTHHQTNMDNAVLNGALQGSAATGEKRPNTETAGSQMSRRRINKVVSSSRFPSRNISQVTYRQYHNHSDVISGPCELDSHADTNVAGANCVVMEVTNQTVNVSAFSESHGVMENIPIVTAATAFDDSQTGITYILILGQSIYLGDHMPNSLICPNQLRANGIQVDDCPRHLAPRDQPSTHSIHSPDDNVTIPLSLKGVTSYYSTRTPTVHELETCKWIILSNEYNWDPHSDFFSSQEDHFQELEEHTQNNIKDRRIYEIRTKNHKITANYDNDFGSISSALDDSYIIAVTNTSTREYELNAEALSKKWCIGLDAARKTLRCTTQKGIRNTLYPIERRFRTKQAQLRYNQLSGRHGRFYTDTFFSSVPSLNGCKMAQLYVNDLSFMKVYSMKQKSEAVDTLSKFIHDVGIPHAIHSDDAPELMQGKFKQLCKDYHIQTSYTEPYSPWQNRAEGGIRELKRLVHRKMNAKKVPLRLWDFCSRWACEIKNKTAGNISALEGRTPFEATLGNTPDISSLTPFDFYDIIWYHDEIASFPEPKLRIGRWLGEAADFGQAMCYWLLSDKGKPMVRSTVQLIPQATLMTTEMQEKVKALDQIIEEKLGGPPIIDSIYKYDQDEVPDQDIPDYITPEYVPVEADIQMPEADEWDVEAFDKYIAAEVRLPKNGEEVLGKVVGRKRDHDGNPIGKANTNPILDTRLYQVVFPDGETAEYSANIIAECIYSQVDDEGNQFLLLDEIIDWKRTMDAVPDEDILQISHNGNIHKRRTTKGWKLCVKWKDGSTSWEPLKDLKQAYPVQVAEFAISHDLQDLPAFRWWVKDTLKRRDRIIKAVKSRYLKRTHKYGIQLPKTVEEAYELDRISGTDFWHQAIVKEMTNNAVAFKFLEDNEKVPPGSQWIPFHMIFDIKCDFTRKARYVAGGHWTDTPVQLTYSSVVTRDSVRIAFLIAALNGLDILAADVGNAYLQAPVREKVHTTAGPEFGLNNVGKTVIVVRAMYGLKSSGAAWHAKFSETLRGMGFKPCLADPDVWMKPATINNFEYYDYILVYVDDVLVISANPSPIMKTLQQAYRLKDPPAPPTTYLGATIKPWSIPTESKPVWSMNCVHYIKEAIKNVEFELSRSNHCLRGKPSTPMQTGYRPELDVTPVLGAEQANYYQSLIGILRWAVELGRIDIYIDVSMLSSHLAEPRIGHLEQVFHIFSYLKHHTNSHLVFDPQYVTWEQANFQEHDWDEFYQGAKEAIPPNALEPRGHAVQMNVFVDANHAGNKVTRRSHTGILIYLNCAPIVWYSKAQNTVESSTFGSEFIAMRITIELLESLRYKLRMMGIPIDGPANVFCDNKSVVTNATVPTSTLKKKHNSIAYHRVREAVVSRILRIAKVHTSENLADLLTKPLAGPQLKQLIQKILW